MTLLGKVLPMTLSGGDSDPVVILRWNFADRLVEDCDRTRLSSDGADRCE
jgi:hypothetical protein